MVNSQKKRDDAERRRETKQPEVFKLNTNIVSIIHDLVGFSSAYVVQTQVTARDVTYTYDWGFHDPTDIIYRQDDFVKGMPELFGPNYNGAIYNKDFLNIRTAEKGQESHHCSTCKHDKSQRCLDLGHNCKLIISHRVSS